MILGKKLIAVALWGTIITASVFQRDTNGTQLPDLLDAELEDLQYLLREGNLTSVALAKAYIQRISEVNDDLHAVTEINPDAESIAKDLDGERTSGKIRGPLHGIPILLKNIIATDDRMNTTAGSFGLLGAKVPSDSTLASKLRAAGAIILGKTNLSQWSHFRSSDTTSGWSAHGGQTVGAYCQDQDPSGSSSGSAVASSIGLAFASLGSETRGSLLLPASCNNVVAVKPTVGLTSRDLVIPISRRQDTVGPIARTVKDAAYVLQAIAGRDPADNYTLIQPFKSPPDYVAAARNYSAFKGARIGVPRNLIDADLGPETTLMKAFNSALSLMESAGAKIVDNIGVTAWAADRLQHGEDEDTVLGTDFISDLSLHYLSRLTSNPHNLTAIQDVRRFTQSFKLEDYPNRDTRVWDSGLALGFNNTSPLFWTTYQKNLKIGGPEGIIGLLSNHSLEALVLPTAFAPDLPAFVGTPVVTVPLGVYPSDTQIELNSWKTLTETGPNIPFGISFLGDKWSEETLIGFAAAFEQKTKVRTSIVPHVVPRAQVQDFLQLKDKIAAAAAAVAA